MQNRLRHSGLGLGYGRVFNGVVSWTPQIPTGLTATVISDTEIQLDWTNVDTTGDGVKVYISTDNVTFTLKTTVALGVATANATGLNDNTLYYFRVVSYKASKESDPSTVQSARTIGWYGIEINEANSSPDVTRIAQTNSMSLHASLPVHNLIKGVLIADNGTVNYYLKADDWTKKADGTASNLDGTDGQVMVEMPEFYYKIENNYPTTGKHQIKISTGAISGFTKYDKHYHGAYEAALNRSTNKLCSLKNASTTYRGGNNTSAWDAAANTLLGKPATSLTRTNYRTYAQARGSGWNMTGYDDYKWLYWLYVIEFATLNSQKAINVSLTAEGYKQGGLGNGVSDANSTEWNNFNGYNPYINCGASDSLANGTGEVSVSITNFGGAGVNRTFKVPRYRGIENPFGHIWKWIDGANIEAQAVAAGNETRLWVSENASAWNDSNYTGYTNRGLLARADGYMSKALMGSKADILPAVSTGGSTTYYCDYAYQNVPASGIVLRGLLVGGHADSGAFDGFAYSKTDSPPSSANARLGARLRFKAA